MTGNERDLQRRLSEAISAADPGIHERIESDPGAYLDLVALAARANDYVDQILQAAVSSARSGGHSWDAIGRRLGMSRQAAQQRFGRALSVPPTGNAKTRTLRPLTAFNEMEVLRRAGRYGWHSIDYGPLFHVVARSSQEWEHRRVYAWSPAQRKLEVAGWQRIGSLWFPWAYFARPTAKPAVPGPMTDDEVLREFLEG